jgi:hypothetical protein
MYRTRTEEAEAEAEEKQIVRNRLSPLKKHRDRKKQYIQDCEEIRYSFWKKKTET